MSMVSTFNPYQGVFGSALFRRFELRDDERQLLRGLGFVRKQYAPRTDLTRVDEYADRAFIVDHGWGCLYKIMPDGERQIIDFPLIADVIGLRGAKGSAQRSFMAVSELVVYEASAAALVAAIARSQRLSQIFIAAETRHKAIIVEHMTNLGRRNALSRTAHLLLELGARLEMVGVSDGTVYECPLTQYDLADALGLTAIHVNRMLRQLRETDLLSFHKGRVELLDPVALGKLAGFDPGYVLSSICS